MALPMAPNTYTDAELAPQPFQLLPYADVQYPSPLELVSSSFVWASDTSAAPSSYASDSYHATAGGTDIPLGTSFLPIPFANQPSDASATALWGHGYSADAGGMAMYMNALDNYSIPAGPADQDAPRAGYDCVAADTATFDEFFHAM